MFHHSIQLAVDLCGRQLLVDGAHHARRSWVATPGWARLGTRVSRLAMKWVRQRCQLAPANTAAMAFFSPWRASEVTTFTPLNPRAVSERRKASQRGLAQKTLHHFFRMKAPGRHRAGRALRRRHRQAFYLPLADLRAGPEGRVCLALGSAVWEARILRTSNAPGGRTVPALYRPSSAAEVCGADEGDNIPTLNSDDRFSTIPALMAAPRWRVEWLGNPSFPGCWSGPP